jgi:hypothetical protein
VELELEGAVVEVLEGVEALLPLTFRVKGIITIVKPLSFLCDQNLMKLVNVLKKKCIWQIAA